MVECPKDATVLNGTCIIPYAVRVNSVGYLSNRIKTAVFEGKNADFKILTVDGDDEVYSGKATGPTNSRDTGEDLYHADFSDFTGKGEFYVSIDGGRSASFRVGNDVFVSALDATMLGLLGQRCGQEVEFEYDDERYFHEACHTAEAELSRLGKSGTRDDSGGWHDAGDYGKYVVNGAFAAAFLIKAYEHFPDYVAKKELLIPESGNDTPDLLDEARVEVEWVLKTQLESGAFSHKVTAVNFEGTVMPEGDTQTRYFLTESSAATGDAVALLALASRLYADFDADFSVECLESARRGQAWLDENASEVVSDQTNILTGGYHSPGDGDERIWALAELWETTGEGEYLDDLESRIDGISVDSAFDWANVKNLGLSTYVRSKREGRDAGTLAHLSRAFLSVADNHEKFAAGDSYGRAIGSYYWGVNGTLARIAFNLITAHYVEPNAGYLDTIQLELDHLFGKNTYARSYVTGLGANAVQKPHHRPSEADAVLAPWPGLLIGGPHSHPFGQENSDVPPALTWSDTYENYLHNEVAINWSTALAYALVAVQAADEDSDPCDGCLGDGTGGAGGSSSVGGAGGAD